MTHLKDQVAVVTGGSSGIGYAVSESLIGEGMNVVIASRNETRLTQAMRDLMNLGGRVLAVPTDVSVSEQVRRLVERTLESFGRIDVLVNNAGIGRMRPISECTEEEWDETQDINLKGAFLCTRFTLPVMRRQRSGYIFNISSIAGKTGFGNMAAYSASKFGMIGLTESLLEEAVDDQIRATAICPGYVATPMVAGASVPAEEMIPPQDIGRLIVGLLHLSPVTVIKEIVVLRRGGIGT